MHRNSLNQQLITSLNPHSHFQTHFPPPNPERFRRPIQRHSVSSRCSIKSGDKKQYLTLVSRDKKQQKRGTLKTSKKNGPKKIQSVILGGEKNTNCSQTNTQKSLKTSLCRSCTSLHQRTQIMTQPSPKRNLIHVQPYLQPVPIIMKPQTQVLIQNPKNEQLNKIISQKLNLDNHPQHESAISMNMFKVAQVDNHSSKRFGGQFVRNTASAGRIYFSVRNSLEKQKQPIPENEKPMSTPRFDKSSPQKQQRRRKNAGFIRSASAPKISYEPTPRSAPDQIITPYQAPYEQSTKQLEIAKCIQKMSSIRKEIDQLQDFLHDRLVTSQLKNKFMYNPSSNCLKDKQVSKNEVSFSTIPVESRLQAKDSQYTPINSIILEKTYQTGNKHPLMEVKSSSLNVSSVSSLSGHCYSKSQQLQPFSSIQNLYDMKCPTSNYSSNIQKQIISEISSKHTRFQKDNQQNLFYHKNPLNSFR